MVLAASLTDQSFTVMLAALYPTISTVCRLGHHKQLLQVIALPIESLICFAYSFPAVLGKQRHTASEVSVLSS